MHPYNKEVRLKIQTRLSQIKNQKDHFHFTESWIIQWSEQLYFV